MSPDENADARRAQFGRGTPFAFALDWLTSIFGADDLSGAWHLTDEPLRIRLAQAFIDANTRHPSVWHFDAAEAVGGLAADPSSHPLWPLFAETQLREFRQAWSWIRLETIGAGSHPRVIAPDVEAVAFLDCGGEIVTFDEDTIIVGDVLTLHMRSADDGRWLVTFGGQFPDPFLPA